MPGLECGLYFFGGLVSQLLPWPVVDKVCSMGQLFNGDIIEIGAFRKELSQQSVCVLVAATFPWTTRMSKVDVRPCLLFQFLVACEFHAVVHRYSPHRHAFGGVTLILCHEEKDCKTKT